MAGHLLQGLMKFSSREPWCDRFDQVLEDHLLPACDETGLEIEDIVPTIGEDLFMSTVWACAFEDFVTREFDDGENAIDDYLKRRGWKETAPVRAYLAALRSSTMSLYEVSDVVRGTSFRARDLLRGGEPVLISERSATQTLDSWDRIAARVVQVGAKTQICGGVLVLEHEPAKAILDTWRGFEALSDDEMRKMAEAAHTDFDGASLADLSPTEKLRAISALFTTSWLIDVIDRALGRKTPDLRNTEGDELILCDVRYPLAAGTTADDIRTILAARPEFRSASETFLNWISLEKPAASNTNEQTRSLTHETWLDDGELVLGNVELEDNALVLSVNSQRRSDLGCALLSELLGQRLGEPSVKTQSLEQVMASRDSDEPRELDIPEEEHRAIVHDYMDRHYRDVLDQPVPMLGGETPRAAVKTDSGRLKVADWLKGMENQTAKSSNPNGPMASYNFGWLWSELGISDLRR
jgi:hypothetical protein